MSIAKHAVHTTLKAILKDAQKSMENAITKLEKEKSWEAFLEGYTITSEEGNEVAEWLRPLCTMIGNRAYEMAGNLITKAQEIRKPKTEQPELDFTADNCEVSEGVFVDSNAIGYDTNAIEHVEPLALPDQSEPDPVIASDSVAIQKQCADCDTEYCEDTDCPYYNMVSGTNENPSTHNPESSTLADEGGNQ